MRRKKDSNLQMERQGAWSEPQLLLAQGRALMAPYLPRNGASGSPYSEGGALYALGLTYANHGHDVKDFLLQSLRETASEVLLLLDQHLPKDITVTIFFWLQ